MIKYIHIGYPKNLSTTLQRDFFAQHKEILHLGVGVNSNIGYIDDTINVALEEALIYCRDIRYSEKKEDFIKRFNYWFEYASERKYKAVGISAELLSFNFSPDHIDTTQKALRLKELFGFETKIIMIVRNQIDLLKSLYKEAIKIGYPFSYRDFIDYCWYFQDRNFMYDFKYHHTYELYKNHFGEENIVILPIEQSRNKDGELILENNQYILIQKLCEALNISYQDIELGHYNSPLSDQQLAVMLKENSQNRHNLGSSFYESVNGHRLEKYFNVDLQLPSPTKVTDHLLTKRKNIETAISSENKSDRIDFYCDTYIYSQLINEFRNSNILLEQITRTQLPKEYELKF